MALTEVSKTLKDGAVAVARLEYDYACGNPLTDCDSLGDILDRRPRHGGQNADAVKALRTNKYAVLLDVYEHSGTAWSLHGEGMQCPWDTSRGAGVWVPDACCINHIEYTVLSKLTGITCEYEASGATSYRLPTGETRTGYRTFQSAIKAAIKKCGIEFTPDELNAARTEVCREAARQACEVYTDWLNGECYGWTVQVFEGEEEQNRWYDSCWGYVGYEHAHEDMQNALNYTVEKYNELL